MSRLEVLNTDQIYRWGNFELVRDGIRLPNGDRVTKHRLRHPGAVVILPKFTDGTLLLLKQYRHAVGGELLEFPAGTLEIDEPARTAAARELTEETGWTAGVWTDLGLLHPAPGFCDEVQTCYLAESLTPGKAEPDADELIEPVRMRPAEFEAEIAAGRVTDAKTLALYLRARIQGRL
jgi:ADP-ribose pyrophosphatase